MEMSNSTGRSRSSSSSSGSSDRSNNELPPLHIAVAYNDDALAMLYLSARHDVNSKEALFGRTALHIAASNDNVKMVQILLSYQANINETSRENLTALHIAVSNRSVAMVNLLLDHGVEVNPRENFHGKTPLYMAVEYGCPAIARMLLIRGASVAQATLRNSTLLHVAVRIGDADMTQLVLQHVPDDIFEMKDNVQGMTPLDLAIQMNNAEIIQLLRMRVMRGWKRSWNHLEDTVDLLMRNGTRIPLPKSILFCSKVLGRKYYKTRR